MVEMGISLPGKAKEVSRLHFLIMGAMDPMQSILATCIRQVIDHFLDKQQQKILFLVPTKALVKQQADYCRQNCRDIPGGSIAEVCGDWDFFNFLWHLV